MKALEILVEFEKVLPLRELPEEIQKEVQNYIKIREQKGEEGMWVAYFNNFMNILPFGRWRITYDLNEEELKKIGGGFKVFRKYVNEKPKPRKPDYSELRKSQTGGEFFSRVDDTLRDLGIYEKTVEVMKGPQETRKIAKIFNLTAPAFFKLRSMGYNRYPDLVE